MTLPRQSYWKRAAVDEPGVKFHFNPIAGPLTLTRIWRRAARSKFWQHVRSLATGNLVDLPLCLPIVTLARTSGLRAGAVVLGVQQ